MAKHRPSAGLPAPRGSRASARRLCVLPAPPGGSVHALKARKTCVNPPLSGARGAAGWPFDSLRLREMGAEQECEASEPAIVAPEQIAVDNLMWLNESSC